MSIWFWISTVIFALVAFVMVLIILVQRPQGGGLAGAFGGAGGGGTETVFGGRVGDVLTFATVVCFTVYLALAIVLNLLDDVSPAVAATSGQPAAVTAPLQEETAGGPAGTTAPPAGGASTGGGGTAGAPAAGGGGGGQDRP